MLRKIGVDIVVILSLIIVMIVCVPIEFFKGIKFAFRDTKNYILIEIASAKSYLRENHDRSN